MFQVLVFGLSIDKIFPQYNGFGFCFYPLLMQETEDFLSNMVVSKTIEAKTDRPAGVVSFTRSQDPNDVLNAWATHLSALMQLVNKTTHLINKEEMVHKHLHLMSVGDKN